MLTYTHTDTCKPVFFEHHARIPCPAESASSSQIRRRAPLRWRDDLHFPGSPGSRRV